MKSGKSDPAQYQWSPQPETASYVRQLIDAAVALNPWFRRFGHRVLAESGTRLVDWLDHIVVPSADGLAELGFVSRGNEDKSSFVHPDGIFPTIVLDDQQGLSAALGIKADSVDHFLSTHQAEIQAATATGEPDSRLRQAIVHFHDGSVATIVERHGYRGFRTDLDDETSGVHEALSSFRSRSRPYDDPQEAFSAATVCFQKAADTIGRSRACDLFFQSEREYWQSRNTAAQVQYQRQQALGLGWANHDHHTYRCSRPWFAPLIRFLELAGFHCRERFYAGNDAGWGAQVLEHSECGIVVFADVDMSAEEVTGDFAHEGLEPRDHLGTVGLWCQLHGDSFSSAGMHHLECQFDFSAARDQLAAAGIPTMAPFTDFPHLKQAFTVGENWRVPAARLKALVQSNAISEQDARRFETDGAIGSHLEILERNDGYKGFNQTGISKIILETNPKNAVS